MRRQAEEAVQKASGAPDRDRLAKALNALNDKLYPIEERLSQYRAKATQDLTNYPNGLDDKLVELLVFAGQADAPPTRQSYELLADLRARLKQRTEALNDVRRSAEWALFAKQPSEP
jgi:hypothetical protein